MQYIKDDRNYIIVLKRGEELLSSLATFARAQQLDSLWLQSGIGASRAATLGSYDLGSKKYIWRTFDGPYEISSLQGNMSLIDNEPFWHIHGVLGTPGLASVTGHVKELTVGVTCELYLTALDTTLTRQFDDETGLKLLTLQDAQ